MNGDGHKDIISGGYPGEIYLFTSNGDGTFRAREDIVDRNGEKINVGGASVPFSIDWDGDGDLDLLVGTIEGYVFFIPNESNDADLRFGEGEKLTVSGEAITAEMGDAGPCVADWNGDGRDDLLLGCGDGRVLFYGNTNDNGTPVLADPVELVPKSRMFEGSLEDYEPEGDLGARAKLCVIDWNGDGRDDLLMGVFSAEMKEKPEPTPAQIAERDSAEAQRRLLSTEFSPKFRDIQQRILKELGVESARDLNDSQREIYSERYQEERVKIQGYEEYEKKMQELTEIYMKYQPKPVYHGWVWVFLRK